MWKDILRGQWWTTSNGLMVTQFDLVSTMWITRTDQKGTQNCQPIGSKASWRNRVHVCLISQLPINKTQDHFLNIYMCVCSFNNIVTVTLLWRCAHAHQAMNCFICTVLESPPICEIPLIDAVKRAPSAVVVDHRSQITFKWFNSHNENH